MAAAPSKSKAPAAFPPWPAPSSSSLSRPAVWVNCAMSLDGKIAYSGGVPANLSGSEDYARVQRIRATADAILVGAGTVRRDDPALRIHWDLLENEELPPEALKHKTTPPIRAVFGSLKGIPLKSRFLDGSQPTVLFAVAGDRTVYPKHVTVVRNDSGEVQLAKALEWMKAHGVDRLMVEGGSRVLTAFLRAGFVDRLTVFLAPQLIGGSRAPVVFAGGESRGPTDTLSLNLTDVSRIDKGVLLSFTP